MMENALAKHVCMGIQRPSSSSLSATKAGQARLPVFPNRQLQSHRVPQCPFGSEFPFAHAHWNHLRILENYQCLASRPQTF